MIPITSYVNLFVFVVVVGIAVVSCSSDGKKFRFDYKYYPLANGWFKLNRVPANWYEARLRCDLEGAVLASPINSDILNAMKAVISIDIDQYTVYTGVHATFSRGDFFSVEGVPLSKINVSWAPNEPNNLEDAESCLTIFANGTMADVNCTNIFPYICYKNNTNLEINDCGTVDNEYTLDSRTGNCYKFHRDIQPWSRAFMTCAAEGGYLAIVNSEVESQVLQDVFAKIPYNILLPYRQRSIANIGFHDWGEHGTWRTIHGQTLQQAGFDKFEEDQPNNRTGSQFCGSIFRSGLLNDVKCDEVISFICEKDPFSLLDDHQYNK